MAEENKQTPAAAKPAGMDRKVKLAFIIVIAIGAALLYYFRQASRPFLPDWGSDLTSAVLEAKRTNVRVLAVFYSDPPGSDEWFLADTTLGKGHNREAVRDGRFVLAKAMVPKGEKVAKGYKVEKLPALLVISPGGVELGRLEGRVGEMPFKAFVKAWGQPEKK